MTYQIFIKCLTGKTITIDTELHVPIQQIKEKIERKESIPIEHQKLIFAGKELQNDLSLNHYGFQPNSTLHLIVKKQNGG